MFSAHGPCIIIDQDSKKRFCPQRVFNIENIKLVWKLFDLTKCVAKAFTLGDLVLVPTEKSFCPFFLQSLCDQIHCVCLHWPMGGCVSKSTWNNEESMHRPCLGMGCCGSKMGKGAFSDRIVSLHNLVSIPNRIIGNGKSRSSCIFTQQGRKGINQDAMIVWEVSFFFLFFLNDVY